MKQLFLSLSLILLLGSNNQLLSQSYYGAEAKAHISSASEIHINPKTEQIDFIQFSTDNQFDINQLNRWIAKQYRLTDNVGLIKIGEFTDNLNQTHIRYMLGIDDVPIHDAMIIAHTKNHKVISINGIIQTAAVKKYTKTINEATALNYALQHIDAKLYKWQIPEEEEFIKRETSNPDATFFPNAEMEIIKNKSTNKYSLSYKFNIYAQQPLSRSEVFVDANNGDILFVNSILQHSDSIGSADTKYSNTQTITSDLYSNTFRLRESGRGLGIETYDMNTSTNYGSAVDFIDSNNVWNNVNAQQDEVATDAHWGLEMTYDYYLNKHNRNSIDGNGFKLKAYVHFDNNYANAYWDGQRMTFGDGNSSMGPLVALDIVGHEITHGLTSYTANLDYQDESGAMNEAFSDIFGTAIEFYAKPATANWLIGEDIGFAMRSMSDPNSKGDPDTYMGVNYYVGSADNGGVHTNSGVLNYLFFLLSDGDVGVNDNNDAYTVNGLGVDTAAQITYRALTVYLTNTSQYADARFYFIKSAVDLYGPCSTPVETTTNAFYAVGIGTQYVAGVHADFNVSLTEYCQAPALVNFENLSSNATNFYWDFGDGDTSSLFNPNHTYTSLGSYSVQLIADGGSCGVDSVIKTEYISVDENNPCIYNMPNNGSQTINTCTGFLFDSGGPDNYGNNTNVTTVISPAGATSLDITFTMFDFESGYDYLKIYDGTSTSGTLIGTYDGNTLPNGGTISSNSGSLTLVQFTDVQVEAAGFVASWQCVYSTAPPVSSFSASDTNSCNGEIKFTDLSSNGPTSWAWDFGDGNSSSLKNPIHNYSQSGTYTVKLIATNSYGNNSKIKTNYITIDKPWNPIAADQALCNSGSVTFTAYNGGNGNIAWYNSANSQNILDTGAEYTTPNLTQSTDYYIETILNKPSQSVGKSSTNTAGSNLNYDQYLIFDVYKDIILKSVKVKASNSGYRIIKLKNQNGTTIEQKSVNVVAGWNTVILNFEIPIGSNYQLSGKDLYRSNSGVSYPYAIPGIVSITKSSASTNPLQYYYYFYEWEIQEMACKSDRVKVIAHINNSAPTVDFSYSSTDPIVSFTDNTTNAGHCYWNFGDGKHSQVSNPNHTYLQNGTYKVTLKVDNGCSIDSISKTVVINSATSINGINNKNQIKLYPNPNNGKFVVDIESKHGFNSLSIFDIIGNNVFTTEIENNNSTISINIKELSSGVYFVRLNSKEEVVTLKFIKH